MNIIFTRNLNKIDFEKKKSINYFQIMIMIVFELYIFKDRMKYIK